MKEFNIQISTENGTGSTTANKILVRSLLGEGFLVTSKNLFPSNISGLPTTFKIRISKYHQTTTSSHIDLYVGFNKKTLEEDLNQLLPHTFCLLNADFKFKPSFKNQIQIDCRKIVRSLHDSPSVKKLLYNMLYVGSTLHIIGGNLKSAKNITKNFLKGVSKDLIKANIKALEAGFNLVEKPFFKLDKKNPKTTYLFEGNSCSALGFLDGGASVATWYPITPSSSVIESFRKLMMVYKKKHISILQCEDEIASAVTALGSGWSGARSFTTTSGPGLSLMQEALGLGYFTESPFVLLDVQRAGPSTGLPTRTAQGDLILAHFSSHGDGVHPVLLPGTPQECYDDAFDSLNLAQSLQTPILILSDLDLGMNEWSSNSIKQKKTSLDKGSVQIKAVDDFKRYSNLNLSPTRSIPRISDSKLAYFTRGTGHGEDGSYSENPVVYEKKLSRLKNKIMNAYKSYHFPKSIMEDNKTKISIVTWGSTGQIYEELKDLLPFKFSYMRIRGLPLGPDEFKFFSKHKLNFIVEQNRDGQLNKIIKAFCKDINPFITKSICQFDGQPIDGKKTALKILDATNE